MLNRDHSLIYWIWGVPLAVLILRSLFQGFLYPWELSGDEAQYWDWSRHPSLSYYTKGPGVTWLITITTSIFGDGIFGIRLGSFLCHGIAGVAVGSIAAKLSDQHPPTVLTTVIGYQCLLGYQIGGSLVTVDMMMVAGWSIATLGALQVLEKADAGNSVRHPLWIMGLGLGFAFLAKYTALLGALGLGVSLWLQRSRLNNARGLRTGIAGACGFLLLGMLPVILWNAQRGWPTIEHLLGHLHVPGGDSGTTSWLEYDPIWTLTYLAQVLGLAGPLVGWIMLRSFFLQNPVTPKQSGIISVLRWSALPLLVFYLLISIKGPTEGNWAVGAYAPLLPLGAFWLQHECSEFQKRIWCILIGIRGLLTGILLLTLITSAPTLNSWLNSADLKGLPIHRISGHQQFADQLHRKMQAEGLSEAPVVCNYYDKTALLAYYLPLRPEVYCASVALGSRPSAYDDFTTTRFPSSRFSGRQVILVGADLVSWELALQPTEIRSLGTLIQRNRPREIFVAKLGTSEGNRP